MSVFYDVYLFSFKQIFHTTFSSYFRVIDQTGMFNVLDFNELTKKYTDMTFRRHCQGSLKMIFILKKNVANIFFIS